MEKIPKRISVWFITGSLPPRFSGAGRNDLLLAPHCKKQGVDITLLPPGYPGDALETIGDNFKILRLHRKGNSFRILTPLFLIRQLRRSNPLPDVVRMRGFAISGALTVFFLKTFFPKIKIVAQPAMFGGDDPHSISQKRAGSFIKHQLMRVDGIFSMNLLFRDSFLKFGFPENRIFMVRNPVDTEQFYPVTKDVRIRLRRQLGLPEEGLILTTLGIIHSRKNQSLITRAFIKVLSQEIREKIYLVHVGPTTKDLSTLGRLNAIEEVSKEEAKLKALLKERGYFRNIFLTGHRDNPAPYLQASDMFVHASNKEGEANVVNEAMACGIPCMVPNSGPYDVQVPASCAYRFSLSDVNDLSNRMEKLFSNETCRISMGRSAANHITFTRSPDTVAAYYANLLRRINALPPL